MPISRDQLAFRYSITLRNATSATLRSPFSRKKAFRWGPRSA